MKVIPPPSVPISDLPENRRLNPIWYRWFSEGLAGAGNAAGETGTYLPSILGTVSNPAVTYTHREGFWIRLGNVVTFHGHIIFATYSGGSGSARFTLPMVAHTGGGPTNYDPTFPAYTSDVDWGTGKQFLYARVSDGTSYMDLISVANNAAAVPLSIGGFSAGSEIAVSATYWTDAP